MPAIPLRRSLACGVVLGLTSTGLGAQCASTWSAMAGGVGNSIFVLGLTTLPNGNVVATGRFTLAGGVPVGQVARWDGVAWSPLGTGVGPQPWGPEAVASSAGGDVFVGGYFQQAGTIAANSIARWDGSSWSALGSGVSGCIGCGVSAITVLQNGDLIVGGSFDTAGGVPAACIARWDGSAWSALGQGFDQNTVLAIAELPDGSIVAGGSIYSSGGAVVNHLARWDGSSWTSLGGGATGSFVSEFLLLPDGDLVVAGAFSSAGGVPAANIAIWDGQGFSALGAGLGDQARSLALLPNGDLVVGGYFTTAGGVPANGLARWDGTTWSEFGGGVSGGFLTAVHALATPRPGMLVAGGDFTFADGLPVGDIAELSSSCVAAASPYGASCSGAAGPNVMRPTRLPWIGADFEATTTGLAAGSLSIGLFGFTQVGIPLQASIPLAGNGCLQSVTDDITLAFAVTAGEARSSIEIPDDPSIAGGTFHHQLIALEVNGAGQLASVTSSNAWSLTVGGF